MQPNMNIQIGEQTEKAIGEVISNVSGDVTKGIGKTLGDIWFIALGGVSQFAEKKKLKYANDLALLKKELDKKVEEIPPEKRIEPLLQVIGPALEKAKYCVEEPELRSMFANLISSALNSDLSGEVQPCFPSIIEQMSPTDAQNINLFNKITRLPIARYVFGFSNGGTNLLNDHVFLSNTNIPSIQKQAISIGNLERQGLISIDYSSSLVNRSAYEPFLKTNEYNLYCILAKSDDYVSRGITGVQVINGIVDITPLGKSFLNVCLPK